MRMEKFMTSLDDVSRAVTQAWIATYWAKMVGASIDLVVSAARKADASVASWPIVKPQTLGMSAEVRQLKWPTYSSLTAKRDAILIFCHLDI